MEPFPKSICRHCTHLRKIESNRGSVFYMCGKSKEDPRLAKYPPQPVIRCFSFQPEKPAADT